MKDLLEYLVGEIVSNPKDVKVEESEEEDGTLHLTISVSPEDMGFIIGKNGRTISAIRSLVKTAAAKQGKEVFVELSEEKK
ncbi:KH domain-containing protein [Candidatus Saccharibacteria bacterium]|nr:KH domain-containing protein [Candidatus Saccharibacteria bacterium]